MKKFGNLESGSFGCNMLCQAAGDDHGEWSKNKKHVWHKKTVHMEGPYGEADVEVECLYCTDRDHWAYVYPTGGGYGYADWDGDGYADGYGDPYGDEGYNDCGCYCTVCKPPQQDQNPDPNPETGGHDSSALLDRFAFTNKKQDSAFPLEIEQMKEVTNKVGREAWVNRLFQQCVDQNIAVSFDYDPFLGSYGHNDYDPIPNRLDITFSNIEDYTMVHELFEAYDHLQGRNMAKDAVEMGSRMADVIMKDNDVINRTIGGRDDYDDMFRDLLANMKACDWDMSRVDQFLWDQAKEKLESIGYNEIPLTPMDFDPTTLREIDEEYKGRNGSGNGNSTGDSSGESYYHAGDYAGEGAEPAYTCTCTCPGCICHDEE